MIDGLGDPEPFFGHGEPLRERTAFGVAEAQPGPGGSPRSLPFAPKRS